MFRSSLDKYVFLRSGLTWACLKSSGNKPEHSDAFIISVIGLSNASRQDFNSTVGSGSSSQDLFGEDIIIFFTSSAVAGSNDTSKEFTRGEATFTVLKYDLGKQNG